MPRNGNKPRRQAPKHTSRPTAPTWRVTPAFIILAAGILAALAILAGAVLDSAPPPASPLPIDAPTTLPWALNGR